MFPQAEYFRDTVLKIEGDNVSAIDVTHHLEILRGNILLRKEEKYLHPDTEAELGKLTKDGNYHEQTIEGVFEEFFGSFRIFPSIFHFRFVFVILCGYCFDFTDNAMDYLAQWTEHFEIFQNFSWVVLENFPDWSTVKKSIRVVEEKGSSIWAQTLRQFLSNLAT